MGMANEGKGNASLQHNSFPHPVYVLQNAVPPVRATTYCIVYRVNIFSSKALSIRLASPGNPKAQHKFSAKRLLRFF